MDNFRKWRKERDDAVLSFDLAKFKKFYNKWFAKGVYNRSLPADDRITEIAMYQMVLALTSATEEQKERARTWLAENNLNSNPWGEQNV